MIQVAPEKIRARRLAAGFKTFQAAARATSLNYKTLEFYEGHKGRTPPANPSRRALSLMAAAYCCSIRDFAVDPHEVEQFAGELLGLIPLKTSEAKT